MILKVIKCIEIRQICFSKCQKISSEHKRGTSAIKVSLFFHFLDLTEVVISRIIPLSSKSFE